jgi:OOP family OmpA-OmpF porin
MSIPTKHWLAALALTVTPALALGADHAEGRAVVTDSDGRPVRGSAADCWRSSAVSSGTTANCPVATPSGIDLSAGTTSSGAATTGTSQSGLAAAAVAAHSAPARVLTVPGYVTDSNGVVVVGSQGECWHTSRWSPELATVVGCDGVLARAVPVPAPAPSPRPRQPENPPATTNASPARQEAPVPPAAASAPEPVSPATAAPRGDSSPPAIIPPAPSAPAPSAAVPFSDNGEPEPAGQRSAEPSSSKVTLDTDTYFDFDKSTLKSEGKRRLDVLFTRIRELDLEVIVATGHTDWTGSNAYNQRLSERRALAVKRYLVQKGLPGKRIFAVGKGEKQPEASNATRAGRARNRRVEVELVGTHKQ